MRANDLVGRLGGDEFVLVCDDLPPADQQDLVARLRTLVHGSVGVATCGETDTAETILARADQQMYADKRARGRPVRG